jgi:hypothetical protein
VDEKELLYRFSCMKEYFEEKLKEQNGNSAMCFITARWSAEVVKHVYLFNVHLQFQV